jgi:hypothetical protein
VYLVRYELVNNEAVPGSSSSHYRTVDDDDDDDDSFSFIPVGAHKFEIFHKIR